ncbi:hypothetical protein HK096_009363, partial [Nowakowskiella sp. JEL0078]
MSFSVNESESVPSSSVTLQIPVFQSYSRRASELSMNSHSSVSTNSPIVNLSPASFTSPTSDFSAPQNFGLSNHLTSFPVSFEEDLPGYEGLKLLDENLAFSSNETTSTFELNTYSPLPSDILQNFEPSKEFMDYLSILSVSEPTNFQIDLNPDDQNIIQPQTLYEMESQLTIDPNTILQNGFNYDEFNFVFKVPELSDFSDLLNIIPTITPMSMDIQTFEQNAAPYVEPQNGFNINDFNFMFNIPPLSATTTPNDVDFLNIIPLISVTDEANDFKFDLTSIDIPAITLPQSSSSSRSLQPTLVKRRQRSKSPYNHESGDSYMCPFVAQGTCTHVKPFSRLYNLRKHLDVHEAERVKDN